MNFSSQLKYFRKQNELSQEELANAIFVSRQTISSWENNKSYPDINNLVALSTYFDTTLDILVKEDIQRIKNVKILNDYKLVTNISTILLLSCIATMIIGRRLLGDGFSILIGILAMLILIISIYKKRQIEISNDIPSKLLDFNTSLDILFILENPGISQAAIVKKKQKRKFKHVIIGITTLVLFFLFIVISAYIAQHI